MIPGYISEDDSEEKKNEAARAYFAAIVESSDDAIVGKTLQGTITSWNRSAERIFGYEASEIVGRSINILIPPDRQQEEEEILERLKRGERVEHFETVRVRKDGALIDVSMTISPINDSRGRIIGASKVARDITERRRAEAEREELLAREKTARARAEEASRLKDEFLAIVSHELRTPLNGILGWVQILRTRPLEVEAVEHALETIERNARSQADIIEDILDVSRIVTGTLRLNIQSIDIFKVIEAALTSMRPAAEAKGILLQSLLTPGAVTVSIDPQRIQQVVWNLLSNAIKFTPRGGQVEIGLQSSGPEIEITVSDTGIGIRPEFLPYVFDRFRQADSSSSRQHSGIGLGLSIVRYLIELHGGSVSAESQGEGQGATFRISIPQTATPRKPKTPTEISSMVAGIGISDPACDLSGIKVLIVDDEAESREILTIMLAPYGAEVKAVSSVGEALTSIREWRPDALVSDIGMPVEDGYALIRKVRGLGLGQGGEIPAVALTAYARSDDRMKALTAGYQMHVAKPVDPVELAIVIWSLAGRAEPK